MNPISYLSNPSLLMRFLVDASRIGTNDLGLRCLCLVRFSNSDTIKNTMIYITNTNLEL